jgi:hypothetical protein
MFMQSFYSGAYMCATKMLVFDVVRERAMCVATRRKKWGADLHSYLVVIGRACYVHSFLSTRQ